MTIDKIVVMRDVPISEFKAKCLGLIEQVHKTGPDRKRKFLGDMLGTAEIVGDIISPVIDLDEIEAYRD